MNLADKKLVAEWMGWDFVKPHHIKKIDGQIHDADEWNPATDRNVWPEIWGKMTEREGIEYIKNVDSLMGARNFEHINRVWLNHVAPPDICTKALLDVIKEQGGE